MTDPTRRACSPIVLVFASGVVFALGLLFTVWPDVFFSGDAGLKRMLTEQAAAGDWRPSLHLPAPAWVETLWARGLYPIRPPFAYLLNGERYMQYPVWFSWICAPLYRLLGGWGMYVVPMAALFASWVLTRALARGLALSARWTALALAALIFASPLTLYGAMVWEHTLAIALGLAGLVLAARTSLRSAIPAGALLGLSFWIRPELVCLLAAVAAAWLLVDRARVDRRRFAGFLLGAAAALAILFAANHAIYGNLLGVHALQVVDGWSISSRARTALVLTSRLVPLLLTYFPAAAAALALLVCGAALRLFANDDTAAQRLFRLLAIATPLFALLLPWILPPPELDGHGGKQWGPRFLLAIMPLAALLLAFAWRAFWESGRPAYKAASTLACAAALGWGVYVNSVKGPRALADDYAGRVLPALERVRADPSPVIAVSSHYVAMELASLARERQFVLADDWPALELIAGAVWQQRGSRFLLVSWPRANVIRGERRIEADAATMRVTPIAALGDYSIQEVTLDAGSPRP